MSAGSGGAPVDREQAPIHSYEVIAESCFRSLPRCCRAVALPRDAANGVSDMESACFWVLTCASALLLPPLQTLGGGGGLATNEICHLYRKAIRCLLVRGGCLHLVFVRQPFVSLCPLPLEWEPQGSYYQCMPKSQLRVAQALL